VSRFEKYFDVRYLGLQPEVKRIKSVMKEEGDYLLIAGDFFGIQKFIFERLGTKHAAKVLRAKSAFVQIFTQYLAELICAKLEISREHILSTGAGKFEILSPNTDVKILDHVQEMVDAYFVEHFYGLSGVTLCNTVCNYEDFRHKEKYRSLRERIADALEEKKFTKLALADREHFVLEYEKNIDNTSLCPVCNIRKKVKSDCTICEGFITLGKRLVKDGNTSIPSRDLSMEIDGYVSQLTINDRIKSYVLKGSNDAPAEFKTLADNSCGSLETGLKSLAVLKADVDSMGAYLKDNRNDVIESFEHFDLFSRTLDRFFAQYVPELMRAEYPNTYTVFAGGDDLFLLGAWDEVLELARRIHDEFHAFTKGQLSISFGIAIAKPSHPIAQLATFTEELLEKAKEVDGKNALTLFNETVRWTHYLKVYAEMTETFQLLKDTENTAFLYRLLELIEMKKKVLEGDVEATMWKSKLRYSWSRNMSNEDPRILESLDRNIENYPGEMKMFLSEYIYKRRTA